MKEKNQPEASGHRWVKRFELLVLRPLDLGLIIAALVSLYRREWVFGCFLFVAGFLVGAVGQGLPHHRRQTPKELRRGFPPAREILADSPDHSSIEELPPEEGYQLALASIKMAFIAALVVAVSLLHLGFRWYVTALAAGLVLFGFAPFCFLVVAGAALWSNRRGLISKWRAKKGS
jgi:hypothetical protein